MVYSVLLHAVDIAVKHAKPPTINGIFDSVDQYAILEPSTGNSIILLNIGTHSKSLYIYRVRGVFIAVLHFF